MRFLLRGASRGSVLASIGLSLGVSLGGMAQAATHHHAGHASHGGRVASAGAQCAPAASDNDAFDVAGLKSELMVTALSCQEQDKYNAFVAKFHPDLLAEEAALNKYFSRAFGRSAQKAHDDYITQLANVQADKGLTAGVAFCQQRAAMLDEVQALDNTNDLVAYAHGKDIVQPADFVTCSAPSAAGAGHVAHITRISARKVVHHH